jgi:hypothetical protein
MVDLLEDISILENAVISFTEGASDEKRGAMQSLESLNPSIHLKNRVVTQ